ncbi:DUF6093 family protein [Arthrobacter sp. VKM Ac-2550]|uniref:DUF6093 family protein n=1 Tax=Crystallibacter permensis TaxID=1938888 RepID=UPI0022279FB9|nr:DUF6093 family protein [Arthrobacter sp. VKM Ac-2550]
MAGTRQSPAIFKRISEGPAPYPLPPDWDPSVTVWTADVRVQELNREGGATAAEQPTTLREYLVACPVGGPDLRAGEQGDIVHVIGRELRILNIMFGSYEFERHLVCVDNQTQQNPV